MKEKTMTQHEAMEVACRALRTTHFRLAVLEQSMNHIHYTECECETAQAYQRLYSAVLGRRERLANR